VDEVRVQSEEPNLKSLLLKQAFCFSALGKISGGGFALPDRQKPRIVGRVRQRRHPAKMSSIAELHRHP
ncbi:hypothetical protein, partial [Enterobacter roggenkampii]|uniref:hypothetical protein n=1 Tax=Enterobacter roggenkampii TaxID=1812935 RepID=UPI001A9781AB